jgi:hypothetical protein
VAVGTVVVLAVGASRTTATALVGGGETWQQAPTRTPRLDPGAASAPYNPESAAQDDARMKMLNEERRRQIPAETERLVELTTELRDIVGQASADETPVGAIRKAAEIQKLAHDIKNRMQN